MSEDAERGIVYIAAGEEFVAEARISAESAKAVMPGVPITLFTDVNADAGEVFDEVREMDDPRYDGGDRVFHAHRTPYERTLFLDADIYFTETVEEIFDMLDRFDVAACINQRMYSSELIDMARINELPESFPEYNGGVLAFRRTDQIEEFLSLWQETYREVVENGQIHNQAALRYALYHSNVQIATLRSEYNCVFRRAGCVNGPVKLFHGRLLDVDSYGAGKTASIEQAVKELNSRTDLRAYYRLGDKVRLAEPSLLTRVLHSIHNRGVVGTVNRVPGFFNRMVRQQ